MNDLTYTLRQLCQRNRDNSHATQGDRLTTLTMISRQLLELGFRQMRASSLKGKHVEALLALWQSEGLAAGTQKNRMVHIRWWQRNTYDGQCQMAGLNKMHGLRHHYAQARYEALTGWKAPLAGGPSSRALTPVQRLQDSLARKTVSQELGHERLQITAIYLGR